MSALFDEEPETPDAPTNFLVVPPTIPADELQAYENAFRRDRRRHLVAFTETDEATGEEIFINADAFRVAMGWKNLPTLAEAMFWKCGS